MKILKYMYETLKKQPAPYYFNYPLGTIISKPIRKWATNVVASNCPFNSVRIFIYRLCGFKIGRHTFIGMHCYLDDMCYDLLKIGNNVTISYGVYFACHGKEQGHYPIIIEDSVYIGMRASIISKNTQNDGERGQGVTIGKNAIIGACSLVNKNVPDDATAVGIPCRIILKNN
jgi:acetyltransferase-like isoleucine patch superfamily enzyme